MMNALYQFISNYIKIPDEDWQLITSSFERKEFARNEIILNEGNVCRYFYFLEKGLVRFYYLKDGNEITRYFTDAPYCFTSKESFRNRKASKENIDAIEECVTWRISLEQSNELLKLKSWNDFTRGFLHEVQSKLEILLSELATETAEKRYKNLLEKHPDVIDRIPLKHLAGFLGIAPQSLSRIRKKSKSFRLKIKNN
jgi:CRP-like cAMP-binding protein